MTLDVLLTFPLAGRMPLDSSAAEGNESEKKRGAASLRIELSGFCVDYAVFEIYDRISTIIEEWSFLVRGDTARSV